ncbi:nucleolin 1-like [Camellia sinensis]|uniref:nucleolin 1-like n=1 Tax=Camellia sinensis TaxID=4442 RepID=UPI001036DB89|nr:nucleolin 1-like [Camellia sinensis]
MANDSVDDINVSVALSTALLLPSDLNRNTELSEYENYALMLQRSAIQHAHSFSIQSFENQEKLAEMKREVSSLQNSNKSLQSKMKKLEDQAEAAIKAQNDAEEKPESVEAIRKVLEAQKREVEEKVAQAQKELQVALATKEAEVKAADEKDYNEGVADVTADYEKQDSPLRNTDALPLPFPPTPSQTADDDSESEEEVLVRKSKDVAGTKSSPQNEQVLDLTQDEKDEEVPKDATPKKASSNVSPADKSLDETLKEIDAELVAEKVVEMSSQQSSEVQTQPAAEDSQF